MDNQKFGARQIAVCDDEPLILEQLAELMEAVAKETGKSYVIHSFQSGKDLLKQIETYHMVFLDIEMPGMDGIQIGQEILKRKPECKIVIISNTMERFKEVLQIRAFRFITKPFNVEEIIEAVEAYENQIIEMKEIKVFHNRNPFWISQKDIIYIVTYDGSVEIVTKNKIYRKDIPLKELKKVWITGTFFRYTVNFLLICHGLRYMKRGFYIWGKRKFRLLRGEKKTLKEYITSLALIKIIFKL